MRSTLLTVTTLSVAGLFLPAAPALAAKTSCAIPTPCAIYTNTSSGPGLQGTSNAGIGLNGVSSSGAYYNPGVDGESTNNSGNDAAGAFGLNTITTGVAPEYGVLAYGTDYGVTGEENETGKSLTYSGYGVLGQDSTGKANQYGDYNVGVAGVSTVGTGVLGTSNGNPTASNFGEAPVGLYGVAGTASGTLNPYAFAFFGETNSFGLDIHDTASNSTAFLLYPANLFNVQASNGSGFTVDYSGNGRLTGTLTTSKSTYVRTTGASGTAMMEYSQRTTAPQVEDVGESQLVNGRSYVSIDARLADTIDRRTAYHVFVTPEGDCKGLYVTQKSAAGFEVRELQGGRASLAFEYRIVAKPIDEDGKRLAIAAPLPKRADDGMTSARLHGPWPSVTPQDRLKRRIGTQAYAQAMLQLQARRPGQH